MCEWQGCVSRVYSNGGVVCVGWKKKKKKQQQVKKENKEKSFSLLLLLLGRVDRGRRKEKGE